MRLKRFEIIGLFLFYIIKIFIYISIYLVGAKLNNKENIFISKCYSTLKILQKKSEILGK